MTNDILIKIVLSISLTGYAYSQNMGQNMTQLEKSVSTLVKRDLQDMASLSPAERQGFLGKVLQDSPSEKLSKSWIDKIVESSKINGIDDNVKPDIPNLTKSFNGLGHNKNDINNFLEKSAKSFNSVGLVVRESSNFSLNNPFNNCLKRVLHKYKFLSEYDDRKNEFVVSEASGTCFLINENHVITALHVLEGQESAIVVFGYGPETQDLQSVSSLCPSDRLIFRRITKTNISGGEISNYKDWCVCRLNEKLPQEFNTLEVDSSPLQSPSGDNIVMVGHPQGLPRTLCARGSYVFDQNSKLMKTTLDSFQGNSGSPVIDFHSNKVIGMLVMGDSDYVTVNGARVPNVSLSYPEIPEFVIPFHVIYSQSKELQAMVAK